ncbi:hypothetical protein A2Y83_01710 [Candidatus Falkowbacteria bacterium RBG_13_39_14]|uniref:Transcription regulator TrmB N-terminal domain-containing protein n=1 Tax=Candidatus Falkowbacteria bacterium RBG_13_39_14 TaxID=1797985 RepID=A0A1F5S2L7_9BACT|nr:MAG: hypothetical protein A2Y83_01710 [Candidatus Falkowbacteria bacterium RBG_13_39_14]
MQPALQKILTELGLTENEAAVYLAALSLGPSTILKIAKTAEIKRTTVYSVVESLKQKGLMNTELKGWKQLFVAENPEKLKHILELKRERLKNSLPDFMSLYNLKENEPFIKYYEGAESVKSIYEKTLKELRPREYFYGISNEENWLSADEKYFKNFIDRRSKLNIEVKLLLQDTESARVHQAHARANEKIKILPKGENLTSNLMLTPQRIVINQLKPAPLSIAIENKSIIRMQKEVFEILWKSI